MVLCGGCVLPGTAPARSPRSCCASLLRAGHSLLPSVCSEWFATSTDSYILRDLDDTSVVEDGRKKLNTLAHYKVNLPALQKSFASLQPAWPRGRAAVPPPKTGLSETRRKVAIAPRELPGNRHLPWREAR